MRSPAERGRSPEHIEALEQYDQASRELKRHQNLTDCEPGTVKFPKVVGTNYNADRHHQNAEHMADHVRLVAARDEAQARVTAADPKHRQSTLEDV